MNFYASADGKNGIQVCGKQHDLVFIRAAKLPNDVASLVLVHGEPRFCQHFAYGRLSRSRRAHQENDHENFIADYGCPRNSPSSMWKW